MSARSLMRQRCTVERETTEGGARVWKAHLTKQPCKVALAQGAEIEVQTGWSVSIDRYTLLLPLGVDIKAGDRVKQVLDRREVTVALEGPLYVDTVAAQPDHQVVTVVVAGGFANAKLLAVLTPGALGINGDPGEPQVAWEGEAPGILRRVDRQGTSQQREQQEAGPARTTLTLIDAASALPPETAGAAWHASKVTVEDLGASTVSTSQWTVKAMLRSHKSGLSFTVLNLDEEVPQ